MNYAFTRSIPSEETYDLVVAGGGPAGSAAATFNTEKTYAASASHKSPFALMVTSIMVFFAFVRVGVCEDGNALISAEGVNPVNDIKEKLKAFTEQRYALLKKISSERNLPLPPSVHLFFEEAKKGNVEETIKLYDETLTTDGSRRIPELYTELFAPVHEVLGVYEQWSDWKENATLFKMFYEPILKIVPPGSVYFGGTDSGRFLVTMANEVDNAGILCVTQNALADQIYMDCLRYMYENKLRIPTPDDSGKAFEIYVRDVQEGRRPNNGDLAIKNGRIQVTGALAVMEINGILAKWIHDWNKDKHDFFIEESYPISWMNPYLRPAGSIMKIEKEPLPSPQQDKKLWDDIVAQDTAHWDELVEKLMAHEEFGRNVAAKKNFSKLRSAIAGIYLFRGMVAEAEYALKQAVAFYPEGSEGGYRLAELYLAQRRYADARSIMENCLVHDTHNENIRRMLDRINDLEATSERR